MKKIGFSKRELVLLVVGAIFGIFAAQLSADVSSETALSFFTAGIGVSAALLVAAFVVAAFALPRRIEENLSWRRLEYWEFIIDVSLIGAGLFGNAAGILMSGKDLSYGSSLITMLIVLVLLSWFVGPVLVTWGIKSAVSPLSDPE